MLAPTALRRRRPDAGMLADGLCVDARLAVQKRSHGIPRDDAEDGKALEGRPSPWKDDSGGGWQRYVVAGPLIGGARPWSRGWAKPSHAGNCGCGGGAQGNGRKATGRGDAIPAADEASSSKGTNRAAGNRFGVSDGLGNQLYERRE